MFGINNDTELWLNNSVSNMNATPDLQYCTLQHEFSNLKVYIVSILYLLGMKFQSGRTKDKSDCEAIIKKEKYTDVINLYHTLCDMGFNIDISDVLAAFQSVYGVEWLVKYMTIHNSQLNNL